MNLDALNINWNDVAVNDFKPLPAGRYAAKITGSEIKKTKDMTGQYIKLEYTLLGVKGIANRKVFNNFNIKNKNEEATKIGLGQFKKLLLLLKHDPASFTDTTGLHGELVTIKLTVRKSEEYGDQNEVKDHEAFDEDLLEQELPIEETPF